MLRIRWKMPVEASCMPNAACCPACSFVQRLFEVVLSGIGLRRRATTHVVAELKLDARLRGIIDEVAVAEVDHAGVDARQGDLAVAGHHRDQFVKMALRLLDRADHADALGQLAR